MPCRIHAFEKIIEIMLKLGGNADRSGKLIKPIEDKTVKFSENGYGIAEILLDC